MPQAKCLFSRGNGGKNGASLGGYGGKKRDGSFSQFVVKLKS